MSDQNDKQHTSALFAQLVLTFHTAAWQQLGKMANPMTGKVERSLELAKHSIDLLGMIEEKTRGNLTDEEKTFLSRTLTELRMNYVDEMKKPDPEPEKDVKSGENKSESEKDESSPE